MHRILGAVSSAAMSITLVASAAAAPSVNIETVEVVMTIEEDGTTRVDNRVQFVVSNGPMTAMIVENMALNPTDFRAAQYRTADRVSNTIITKIGAKSYDIEAVPKIPNGKAELAFRYGGNVVNDGYVGTLTKTDLGNMYYFDWAPMRWETALRYREVRIVLPGEVSGAVLSDEEFEAIAGYSRHGGWQESTGDARILTDRALNGRNRIDYSGTLVDGKYRLTMHVRQENVAPREAQRIQFYIKEGTVHFASPNLRGAPPALTPGAFEAVMSLGKDGTADVLGRLPMHVENSPYREPLRFTHLMPQTASANHYTALILAERTPDSAPKDALTPDPRANDFYLKPNQGIPVGDTVLSVHYDEDIARSDNVRCFTDLERGEMLSLRWPLPAWSMSHGERAVTFVLPVEVSGESLSSEEYRMATGHARGVHRQDGPGNALFVPDAALAAHHEIAYFGAAQADGTYRLAMRVVAKGAATDALHIDMPKGIFPALPAEMMAVPPEITVGAADIAMTIDADGTAQIEHRLPVHVRFSSTTQDVPIGAITPAPQHEHITAQFTCNQTAIAASVTERDDGHYAAKPASPVPVCDAELLLQYRSDLAYAGIVGTAEGMHYLEWNPPRWRSARIAFPTQSPVPSQRELSQIEDNDEIVPDRDALGNARIAYRETDVGDGKSRITVEIVRDPDDLETERAIRLHADASRLPIDRPNLKEEGSDLFNPDAMFLPPAAGIGAILIAGFVGALAIRRTRTWRRRNRPARSGASVAADMAWEAPQLEVGEFAKPGKVASDLHPLEVGMLLGLEISQIIEMVAQAMHDQGSLVIRSRDPIQAIPVGPYANEIERRFAAIFDESGDMDVERLNDFLEWAVTEMQDRSWDCDLGATRSYYLDKLYDNPTEADPSKLHYKFVEGRKCDEGHPNAHYWRYCSEFYTGSRMGSTLKGLRESLGTSIADFAQESGPAHVSLENACYSACHSACVSGRAR